MPTTWKILVDWDRNGDFNDTDDATVRRVGGAEASSILALDGTHVD
jgi:hypothetical protein